MNKTMVVAWRYTPILLLALAWEAITQFGLISEYALPTFTSVLVSFGDLFFEELLPHTAQSVARGFTALVVSIVVGMTAGVLMAWYKPVRVVVNPFIQMFYPLPKSALIPLTIMWLGLGDVSKISLIFIGCLLPVVVSAFNAARGVENVLVWSARGLGATEREVLREVVVPAALPEILNGIRVALALAFILMVTGELIIANNGIGFLINFLGDGGDYKGMFAGVIMITAVGFCADRLYLMGMRRILIWRE